MKRILIISAFALAGLIVVFAIAAGALLYSQPGRNFIISKAESAIGNAIGGEADISALKGAPPGYLIVEDVVLSDAEGVWARIDRIEIRWRPLKLLNGKIDISALTIADGAILRPPPEKPKDPNEADEPFRISLPEELPKVRVQSLDLSNFQSELGGVAVRLDGGGAVDMGGESINLRLNLTSADEADNIDLTAEIAPDSERVFIDATIAASESGVIAAFADLGGPLFVEIKSDAPTSEAEILLNADIGAYGELETTLLADFMNEFTLNADGVFSAGVRLSDIPELADPVEFDLDLKDARNGGTITINSLATAAGKLAGDIAWRDLRRDKNSLTTDLRVSFDPAYRPEIQNFLGQEITLTTQMQRRQNDYALELRLRGGESDISVASGATNLKNAITGDLSAIIAPRDESLPAPARITTRFNVDLDDSAALRALTLSIGDIFEAQGDADFRFSDETLRFEGDIDAEPEFVTTFAPGFQPEGPIAASIDANGAADNFTLKMSAETPVISMGENTAPALTANISLAGLPLRPTGDISAAAKNGAGDFSAQLRSSVDGRIAAPSIVYNGPGFTARGSGAYNPDVQNGEIDFAYNGGADAEPWPGLVLAGNLNAQGAFAREGQATDLTISADSLRTTAVAVQGLSLRANGPPSAISVTLKADEIAASESLRASRVNTAAIANVRDSILLRITKLNALLADNTVELLEPGRIGFNDGANIENIRLAWGREGRIAIDGAFSPERWRGDINLKDVNIPQTDGRATLQLQLDTDAASPAMGAFSMTSLVNDATAVINGKINWNGDALILSSANDEDGLDMRLALPAALTKTPSISVSTQGPLDGYVRYDGSLEPLAAFMPPELQTLEGKLKVDFQLSGRTDSPELGGYAEIDNGAYTELQSGLSIAGLHVRADAQYAADGSRIDFSGGAKGGGQTGEDSISINGEMLLNEASSLDIDIIMQNAVLSAHPVNSVRADGTVSVKGPLDKINTTGEITINELDAEIITPETTGLVPIEVVNIEEAANGDPLAAPSSASVTYDINIIADDRIFVRGRGLDSEWAATVRAVSMKGEPVILGDMRLRRGTFDFSGRRFDVTRGRIDFDRLSVNNPLLDIRAEFETSEGVTATIQVSGRAKEPTIELNSVPDLPDEDIMALVLFGKPAEELSAFESLQTAQALASLGGIGPFGGSGGFTSSLRQATGLDLLNIDIDPETGGGSLTVGKYVADGLFVSATQDAQGKGGAVIVEYEITDNISVETEVRQDGDQTVSANWKKDF